MSDQAIGQPAADTDWTLLAGPVGLGRRLGAILTSAPAQGACTADARASLWIARAAWATLVVLLVVGGAPHVPWFDEAQAWLIARDATPWEMVSRIGRYEGTPMLWHLILWALQRVGYPYAGLWLVSSAFAAAGAWVTLHKAPFPLWLRIGLVFAYFPAFQFAVVARSYALDLVAFPLIAAGYRTRCERPVAYALLLGVTANTNAFAFLFATVFAADLAWALRGRLLAREGRAWASALVFCALALAAAAQAHPAADVTFSGPPTALGWAKAPVMFKEALFSRADLLSISQPSVASHLGGLALSLGLMVLAARLALAAGRLWLFAGGVAVFVLFAVMAYGSLWHAGMLYLFVVAMLWIGWDGRGRMPRWSRRALTAGMALFVASSAIETGAAYALDAQAPYSSSAAAARWIAGYRAVHPGARIDALGYVAMNAGPYVAKTPFDNYDAGPGRPGYYLWSRRIAVRPHPSIADLRADLLNARPDALVLSTVMPSIAPPYLAEARRDGYRLAARLDGAMVWKGYPVQLDTQWALVPVTPVVRNDAAAPPRP